MISCALALSEADRKEYDKVKERSRNTLFASTMLYTRGLNSTKDAKNQESQQKYPLLQFIN